MEIAELVRLLKVAEEKGLKRVGVMHGNTVSLELNVVHAPALGDVALVQVKV